MGVEGVGGNRLDGTLVELNLRETTTLIGSGAADRRLERIEGLTTS